MNNNGPNQADLNLLEKYGSIEELEKRGFYGTVDRLKMINSILGNKKEKE